MTNSIKTTERSAARTGKLPPCERAREHYFSRADVLAKLDAWLTRAFDVVSGMAEHESSTLRDAACLIAEDRTARASVERGWV